MKASAASLSGLVGAATVTLLHESVKKTVQQAPRMDLLGMNALSKILYKLGEAPPGNKKLYRYTMAGDIVANSAYYALIGAGGRKNIWTRGLVLGLAAGLGGVFLPRLMGLNEDFSSRTTKTSLMTIGLYVAGGLATAAVLSLFAKKKKKPDPHLM